VVVRLLDRTEWKTPSSLLSVATDVSVVREVETVGGDVAASAPEAGNTSAQSGGFTPTGRVVGIVERCGRESYTRDIPVLMRLGTGARTAALLRHV
jgi:hypothetical protein